MNRAVLFLPQNDSHAETTVLLSRELSKRGLACAVLDLDGVFHQGTVALLAGLPLVQSGMATERPFYRLPSWHQIQVVREARARVHGWLPGIDAVVAFNDGAVQRVVLTAARQARLPTDMVLDGMITRVRTPPSPGSLIRGALRAAGRRLNGTAAGAYLPSEVGLAPVERTHVAGEHSAEVIRSRGSKARQVLASGLPRWPDPETVTPSRVRQVLYLTGAFRWHGDPETASAQVRDVALLADACRERSLALAVRVHPRDDMEPYAALGVGLIDARAESITTSIRKSDLVMAIISTGLIEAVLLGKPSRVLAVGPRWSRYRDAFVADPVFGALRDAGQLRTSLQEFAVGVDPKFIVEQRRRVAKYVAATGSDAARRIAATIGEPI